GGGERGLISGRDDVAEAETPRVAQQANAQPAALRDDADIAGQSCRIAQFLQICRAGMMRVEHAHAVGSAQRNVRLAADPRDFALQSAPLFALLGKAAIVDHGTLDPALRRRDERPENARVADTEHCDIGRFGQFGHVRVTGMTKDSRVARIDRIYPAGEADPIERGNDPPADRRLLRRADYGDRPGLEQRFKRHRHSPCRGRTARQYTDRHHHRQAYEERYPKLGRDTPLMFRLPRTASYARRFKPRASTPSPACQAQCGQSETSAVRRARMVCSRIYTPR